MKEELTRLASIQGGGSPAPTMGAVFPGNGTGQKKRRSTKKGVGEGLRIQPDAAGEKIAKSPTMGGEGHDGMLGQQG